MGLVPFIYAREHRRRTKWRGDGEGFSLGQVGFEVPEKRLRGGVRAAAGNVDPKFESALWFGGVD